jgi:hypothetical protein
LQDFQFSVFKVFGFVNNGKPIATDFDAIVIVKLEGKGNWLGISDMGDEKYAMHKICPSPIRGPRNSCTSITKLSISNPENLDKYYLAGNGK